MLCHSSKHILLIDHTKFGQTHMVSDCPWSEVDVVITDEEPPKEFLKTFEENKVQLVIAS